MCCCIYFTFIMIMILYLFLSGMLVSIFFFNNHFIFTGKSHIQRGGETEGLDFLSVESLPKLMHQPELSLYECHSLETLLGLPHRFRVPKLWAILECFPMPQEGAGWEVELLGLESAPHGVLEGLR